MFTLFAAKGTVAVAPQIAVEKTGLPDTGWLTGEYSIADIHLYNVCRWLSGDGVDINAYPKLAAHFAAMQARPAVIRAIADHG